MIGKTNKRILAILIVLLMIAVAFTVISTAQDTPNNNGDDDDPLENITDIYEKSVVPNALGKPPLPRCSLDSGDDDSPGEA